MDTVRLSIFFPSYSASCNIMRRNNPHEWERTMFSSTQECAGRFNGWHKIVKQNNGRKKNKTNIKMCTALINDDAAVARIADCDLDNYMGLCTVQYYFLTYKLSQKESGHSGCCAKQAAVTFQHSIQSTISSYLLLISWQRNLINTSAFFIARTIF
jgi:hypothetical protein